jgi:hypothetical protein
MARLQSNTWIYGTATITGVANLNSGILFSDGSTLSTSNNIAGAFTAANVAYGRIQITANTNGGIFANGTQGVSQTGNVLISISNTHITNAVTSNTTMGLQLASAGIGVAASGITGEIRASTAASGTSNTMLATTAFVGTATTNIVVAPFTQANNSFNVANAAYNQANSVYNRANSSIFSITANTNGALFANGTQGVVQTGNVLISLANTSVSTGSYSNANTIAVFTVDGSGRLTYAANVPVSITSSQVSGLPINTFITANTNGGIFANGTQGTTQTGNVLISISNTHITNAVTSNTTMGLQLTSLGVGVAATGIAGVALAATAATGTSNTMLATTAFVATAVTNGVTAPFAQANNAFNVANASYNYANSTIFSITANTNGGIFANGTQGVIQTANALISISNTHITNAVTSNTTMGLQVTSLGVGVAPTGVAGVILASTAAAGTSNTMLATTAFATNADTNAVVPPFTQANNAFNVANAAFTQANNAPPAFNQANNAFNVANAAFTQANSAYYRVSITANTNGALFANGTQGVAQTGNVLISLANTAVTAGTYGGTTQIPVVTIDGSGRATYAANVTFSGGASITNDITTATSQYPLFASATSGTLSYANTSSTALTFVPSTGTLGATIFNSLSDKNKKKKIKKIKNALDVVNQLEGVEFEWKNNNMKSYGVIAQDLEEVIPDLVTTDDMGNKSVNYNGLFGFLINAIQEQQKQIDKLTKK